MMTQVRPLGSAGAQPTLDDVWRDLATRPSRRAALSLTLAAIAAALASRWAALPWGVTLVAVIVMAFGCDALLQAGAVAGRGSPSQANRVASTAARTVAAAAAGAIGLIVLGMIFGDKIEVMRR